MSMYDDSKDLQPKKTLADAMMALRASGTIPPPTNIPAVAASSEDEPVAPYGLLTVVRPKFRVMPDSRDPENETALWMNISEGVDRSPRPRTAEEAEKGITEVESDEGAYVNMKGQPCEPAGIREATIDLSEGSGFFKSGLSSLENRKAFKLDWHKTIATGPQPNSSGRYYAPSRVRNAPIRSEDFQ